MGNAQSGNDEIVITRRSLPVSPSSPKDQRPLSPSFSQPSISPPPSPISPSLATSISVGHFEVSGHGPWQQDAASKDRRSIHVYNDNEVKTSERGIREPGGAGTGRTVGGKVREITNTASSAVGGISGNVSTSPSEKADSNSTGTQASKKSDRSKPKSQEKIKEKLRRTGKLERLGSRVDLKPPSASHLHPDKVQSHQIASETPHVNGLDKSQADGKQTDTPHKTETKLNPLKTNTEITEEKDGEGVVPSSNTAALTRSRGYTHVGVSTFISQGDHVIEHWSRDSQLPQSRDDATKEREVNATKDKSQNRDKEVQAGREKTAMRKEQGMRGEARAETRAEALLAVRPRRNSLASFGFTQDDPESARQASVIIAALKRASQRIEFNLKSKKAKPKVVKSPQDLAAAKIQATFRMWVAVRQYRKQLQRTSVVREILITELDYVRFLSVLVKVYYYPLRKANIVTPEEIDAIFPQIEIIKIYNSKFVEVLQKKLREWNAYQTIGDAFLSMVDVMRDPYAIYISQFPEISSTIASCSRRRPVAQFLQKCTKFTEVASMDLLSLASMPFQRIPRYMLLLKECLKYTTMEHRDYEQIRMALKKLDSLTQAASERLRMTESSKSVVRISEMCDPPIENLVRPYRKLLRDGMIDAQFIPNSAKEKDHPQIKNTRLYLFTDCLLVAKPHKKSFFGSNSEQKLKPIAVLDLRGGVLLDVGPMNEFRLRVQTGLAIFQTKNWPEKEAWKCDLTDAIDLLGESSDTSLQAESLSRSASLHIETVANRGTLVRTKSQFQLPLAHHHHQHDKSTHHQHDKSTHHQHDKSTHHQHDKSTHRPPRRLTRQFTIPQINNVFASPKLAAPKETRSPRFIIGRSASHKSFFFRPGTTHRKQKEHSVHIVTASKLRKAQSLPL